MKLALIQTKQNELYNFPGTRTFDTEEVLRLRHEYMEEVFRMTEEAAKEGDRKSTRLNSSHIL